MASGSNLLLFTGVCILVVGLIIIITFASLYHGSEQPTATEPGHVEIEIENYKKPAVIDSKSEKTDSETEDVDEVKPMIEEASTGFIQLRKLDQELEKRVKENGEYGIDKYELERVLRQLETKLWLNELPRPGEKKATPEQIAELEALLKKD
jgi:uncharacterized coiled-coil DUF342 family protein